MHVGRCEPVDGASKWRLACRCATSDGIPRRSLWVAAVVGTALNLINQGDALLTLSGVNWLKLGLTYCVPYAVCTYGAVSSRMAEAARDARRDRRDVSTN